MKILKVWIPLLLSVFFITACTTTPFSKENTTYERIKASNKIIVGMSGEQPPFSLFVEGNGAIGLDVDISSAVAKKLGVEFEIKIMKFENLQTALKNNEIDMIISSFSVSEERKKDFLFSEPYAEVGKSLLTTKVKLKEITNSTGFNDASVNIVALENSTSLDLIKKRMPKANITAIAHYEDALLMIRAGEADALVTDLTLCELAIIRDGQKELTMLHRPLAVEDIAIAINKNEPLLNDILSGHIKHMKDMGKIEEIRNSWFTNPRWIALIP